VRALQAGGSAGWQDSAEGVRDAGETSKRGRRNEERKNRFRQKKQGWHNKLHKVLLARDSGTTFMKAESSFMAIRYHLKSW